MYNSADNCFAIYKTLALKEPIILFTNGITTKVLDVSKHSYKVKVLDYVGWIPESVITDSRK